MLFKKKSPNRLLNLKKATIFAPAYGLVAQLNSALDYGSRGYWFESSRGHEYITKNVNYKASFRNEARFFFGKLRSDSFCDVQSGAFSGSLKIIQSRSRIHHKKCELQSEFQK